MSNTDRCPVCQDPLGAAAVTVDVDGATLRVCCPECAREAADPTRLRK